MRIRFTECFVKLINLKKPAKKPLKYEIDYKPTI